MSLDTNEEIDFTSDQLREVYNLFMCENCDYLFLLIKIDILRAANI